MKQATLASDAASVYLDLFMYVLWSDINGNKEVMEMSTLLAAENTMKSTGMADFSRKFFQANVWDYLKQKKAGVKNISHRLVGGS